MSNSGAGYVDAEADKNASDEHVSMNSGFTIGAPKACRFNLSAESVDVGHEASTCKCCIKRLGEWKQSLILNSHGCHVCRNVFDASSWTAEVIRNHKRFNRALVCQSCKARGYSTGRYATHQCHDCSEHFGSLNFDKQTLRNSKRSKKCALVCRDCQSKLRCSKCSTPYEVNYWMPWQRKNHSFRGSALVCKRCRMRTSQLNEDVAMHTF